MLGPDAFSDDPRIELGMPARRHRDDDDDSPPRRHKRRKDEDDQDDRDDEPRKGKKKKPAGKSSNSLMYILLGGGGLLALFACCGCGIGGFFFYTYSNPNIVGRWENKEGIKLTYEFREDGTGKIDTLGIVLNFNYTLKGNELTMTPIGVGGGLGNIRVNGVGQMSSATVSRSGDTLRLRNPGAGGQELVLKKIG